jgi:hypothetical protein
VYTWKQLWPILAGRFGLEWVGYDGEENRFKLMEAMARKEAVWAEIVRENELVPGEDAAERGRQLVARRCPILSAWS